MCTLEVIEVTSLFLELESNMLNKFFVAMLGVILPYNAFSSDNISDKLDENVGTPKQNIQIDLTPNGSDSTGEDSNFKERGEQNFTISVVPRMGYEIEDEKSSWFYVGKGWAGSHYIPK